jgi:hypothetical protein
MHRGNSCWGEQQHAFLVGAKHSWHHSRQFFRSFLQPPDQYPALASSLERMHMILKCIVDMLRKTATILVLNGINICTQPPKGELKGKNKLSFSDGRDEHLTGKCIYFVRLITKVLSAFS